MSDADADISSAAQPTISFKRKKRPAAARTHHRPSPSAGVNDGGSGADGADGAETPLSGFEGDVEDSTRCVRASNRRRCLADLSHSQRNARGTARPAQAETVDGWT